MIDSINSVKNIRIVLIHIRENEVRPVATKTSSQLNLNLLSSISATQSKPRSNYSGSTKDLTENTTHIKILEITLQNLNGKESITNSENSFNIIDLKQKISEKHELKIDSLIFYTFEEKPKKLNDNEELLKYLKNISTTGNSLNSQALHNIFYYSISNNPKININIEYHQNNISTINFELNLNCSIYLLKYLLNRNLESHIPIREQSLKILSISQNILNESNSILNSKNSTSNNFSANLNSAFEKELNDEDSLMDIIKNSIESEKLKKTEMQLGKGTSANPNQNFENYSINFLLIQKSATRVSIGLDFSFTLLKDLKKIKFEAEAPSFRAASDGLNIFFYCLNPKCPIYNDLFLINLRYGKFNIINEINSTRCLNCRKKNIIAKNLGFVNCEWKFTAIMTNKKSSFVNGDGITIDKNLYIMKETNILVCFSRLEIRVKEIDLNFVTVSSYESDIELEDIVAPLSKKKNIQEQHKNSNVLKEMTGSEVSKGTENYYNQNKNENLKIGYKKNEITGSEITFYSVNNPTNIEKNFVATEMLKIKDNNKLINNTLTDQKCVDENLVNDTLGIRYETKKQNICCVNNDVEVLRHLKNSCVLF